jgi:hypothetical protein
MSSTGVSLTTGSVATKIYRPGDALPDPNSKTRKRLAKKAEKARRKEAEREEAERQYGAASHSLEAVASSEQSPAVTATDTTVDSTAVHEIQGSTETAIGGSAEQDVSVQSDGQSNTQFNTGPDDQEPESVNNTLSTNPSTGVAYVPSADVVAEPVDGATLDTGDDTQKEDIAITEDLQDFGCSDESCWAPVQDLAPQDTKNDVSVDQAASVSAEETGAPSGKDIAVSEEQEDLVSSFFLSMPNGNGKAETSRSVSATEIEVLSEEDVTVSDEQTDFVSGFLLSMPNGNGETEASRDLRDKLVATHVLALQLPQSKQEQKIQAGKFKAAKKTEEAKNMKEKPADAQSATFEATINESVTIDDYAAADEPAAVGQPISTALTDGELPQLGLPVDIPPKDMHGVSEHSSDRETEILLNDTAATSPHSVRGRSPHSSVTAHSPSRPSATGHRNAVKRKIYEARNTYLGVTSLEDFVEELEFDLSDRTTTKADICEAFATLSVNDTEAITGKRTDVAVDLEITITQRRIKLGTTSLYAFLRGMRFDDEGITSMHDVVSSFKRAAKKSLEPSVKLLTVLSPSGSYSSRRSSASRCALESNGSD